MVPWPDGRSISSLEANGCKPFYIVCWIDEWILAKCIVSKNSFWSDLPYNPLLLLSIQPHWFFGKRSKLRLYLIFCCCNATHQKTTTTTTPLLAIIIIKVTKAKMSLQNLNQKYLPTSIIKFSLTN